VTWHNAAGKRWSRIVTLSPLYRDKELFTEKKKKKMMMMMIMD